jgi:Ca2+-binding RTX toxin-like protein
LSHRNPLEALEPRTLLSNGLPTPPPSDPGFFIVGRTCYLNGTAVGDTIRLQAAGNDAKGNPQPTKILMSVGTRQFTFGPSNMRRFIVRGFGGDDSITVDAGLPSAFHPGTIILRGGDGNDRVAGGDRDERIFGDAGDDILIGSKGDDELRGDVGNDNLDGGDGRDRLFGDAGDDTLAGGAGNDFLFGDDGNDSLTGGAGNDILFGGIGDDTFVNNEPAADRAAGARDLLNGGGGNDHAQNDPADHYRLVIGGS